MTIFFHIHFFILMSGNPNGAFSHLQGICLIVLDNRFCKWRRQNNGLLTVKFHNLLTVCVCGCNVIDSSLPLCCERRWRCLRTCPKLWYHSAEAQLSSNGSFHLHLSMTSAPTYTHPAVGPGRCTDVSGLLLHLKCTLVWAFVSKQGTTMNFKVSLWSHKTRLYLN